LFNSADGFAGGGAIGSNLTEIIKDIPYICPVVKSYAEYSGVELINLVFSASSAFLCAFAVKLPERAA